MRGSHPIRPVKILDVAAYEQVVKELRWAEEKAQIDFERYETAIKAEKKDMRKNVEKELIKKKMMNELIPLDEVSKAVQLKM